MCKSWIKMFQNKIPVPSKMFPLDIQLGKEVDSIRWKTDNGLVKVVCKDGSIYEAKSVISSISVGVLKDRCVLWF